jgi:hypothetical protein
MECDKLGEYDDTKSIPSGIVRWHNPSPYSDYYYNLSVFLINPLRQWTERRPSPVPGLFAAVAGPTMRQLEKEEGNAAFAAIVKILISELTVGICPRADCVSNECQKPFSSINVRITPGLR